MPKTRLGFARPDTLRVAPIVQLLIIAALSLGVGITGHRAHVSRSYTEEASALVPDAPQLPQAIQNLTQSAPAQAIASAGAAAAAALAPAPVNATREAEIDDGENFAEFLADQGVSSVDATAAMNALSKTYDLRKMQAGQDVTLTFVRTGSQETFTGAVFQPEDTKEITLSRTAQNDFTASVKIIPITRQRLAAAAEIRSSVFEAGSRVGVSHAVMASLIHVYSHDVDFQRDIHPGDSFEVLYDQPVTAKGKPVGESTIIYAALHISGKVRPIYRVTFNDGTVDYFDEKGQSVRRALLRTPVAAAHITSGFGMRMHPILGYSKMHKGVDFGAPVGTPIFAAGNGVIEDIGFRNGYGRYIRIRHNNSLETAYAHMSRFGANMFKGAHVNQGGVIGYVGMSGRATGPHLHFETLIAGKQVNPLSVNMPTGRTLEGKLMAAFKQGQGKIHQEFTALLSKNDKVAPTTSGLKSGVIQASATAPAFAVKETNSCGLRGGC